MLLVTDRQPAARKPLLFGAFVFFPGATGC